MPPTRPRTPLRHMWTFIAKSLSAVDIDRQLASEVELSSTSQTSRRLSVVNSIYVHTPVRQVKWLKIAPVWCVFRANLSMWTINRRCAGSPMEPIAKHFQLQLATTSQVGRQDMRARLNSSVSCQVWQAKCATCLSPLKKKKTTK